MKKSWKSGVFLLLNTLPWLLLLPGFLFIFGVFPSSTVIQITFLLSAVAFALMVPFGLYTVFFYLRKIDSPSDPGVCLWASFFLGFALQYEPLMSVLASSSNLGVFFYLQLISITFLVLGKSLKGFAQRYDRLKKEMFQP